MAETLETPPVIPQAAPSTALPKLDGITQEDLRREISGDDAPEKKKEVPQSDEKSHVEEKPLDGFGKAAKEMMDKKARGESTDAPDKSEEKPAKKEAVSADDAQPIKKEELPAGRLPDDQLRVLPHDKPLTARRIEQLLKDKADLAKERDEARVAAKANPTASNVEEFTKLKEEHQKASDELTRYRRRYEIDTDETFKKTYDEPISNAEVAIENTLKKYQLGDATLKAIKDEGGFAAFSRSSKTFPITELDEAGDKKTVMRTAAELARGWINGIAIADGEFIRSALGKQALLADEKKTATERAVGESKQFFEAREKQSRATGEAAKKRDEELAKNYQTWLKTTTESTDWMKDKPVPDNATDVQRKQIDDHNQFNKQLRDDLNNHPKNSDDYYKLRLEAVESRHLKREMTSKDEKIKALEAELARAKNAGRTTPKGGSLLSDAGKPAKKDDNVAPEDFKTAFRRSAQAKMGGDDE